MRQSTCKFIGVVLDEISEHIKYIHSKLSCSLYALNRSTTFVPTLSEHIKYIHSKLSCSLYALNRSTTFVPTLSEHIKYIHSKLSGSLCTLNRSTHFVPTNSLKTLYYSLVHTHLTYGVTIGWNFYFLFATYNYLPKERIFHNKPYKSSK